MARPKPITVGPYRASPVRERGGLWYWRVTEGGARGRDVSGLLPARWATVEQVTCALREAAQRHGAPVSWTLADLLRAWLKAAPRDGESPHTHAGREKSSRLVIDDALGAVDVDALREADLLSARHRLLAQYAPSTVGRAFVTLRTAWNWARDEGALTAALPRIALDMRATRAKPIPTEEEVQALADALDGWHRVAFLVLVETGARAGEIMSLTRERCDLRQGVIHVSGKLTRRISPTATRPIPLDLDGQAIAALRSWCADRLPGPLWPDVVPHALDMAMRRASRAVGLRELSPNAFRRRADILLINARALAELPRIMDHSLAMALQVYALPEAPALRSAVQHLGMGATQARDTGAAQAIKSRR